MKQNKKKKRSRQSFVREIFSENGYGSSKRVLGSLVLIVCLGCLVYLVKTEGGTSVVEGIMNTFIYVACILLGLGVGTKIAETVTGAKRQQKKVSDDESDETEERED